MNNDIPDIKFLLEQGYISYLDYYFAQHLASLSPDTGPLFKLACSLLSRAVSRGHVFLDLDELQGNKLEVIDEKNPSVQPVCPLKPQWIDALTGSGLVSGTTATPLVLESGRRLYLSRYHDFQQRLVDNIVQRVSIEDAQDSEEEFKPLADPYFSGSDDEKQRYSMQRQAVLKSLMFRFSIITGGPGTGKTHITRIVMDILEKNPAVFGRDPAILSLAPTGKAAARLYNGKTIHRAIGIQDHKPGIRHHKDNPVKCDVVIIDEASMIDMALMVRLLEAIPLEARVVMLGDPDQLASVETGAVFGDICRSGSMSRFISRLEYNFRSESDSAVDRMARAIQNGDVDEIKQNLAPGRHPSIKLIEPDSDVLGEADVAPLIQEGYRPFLNEHDPVAALELLDRFKILCAVRHGPSGTHALNRYCKNLLRSRPDSGIPDGLFKKAVMITRNDYSKDLFNGDTGIFFIENDMHKAIFRHADGRVHFYNPAGLTGYEDAFAVTVHKSQGSEYDHVLLVLPRAGAAFLTRQLLYTGFTRARRQVTLVGKMDVILEAGGRALKRHSNITPLLDKHIDI